MAFTVDFGDNTEEKKKPNLTLRDSIGRFAPAKIKSKLNKDNTNCKEVILDEENNIAHKKDAEPDPDQGSDTGTYTIEDEDVEKTNEKSDRNKDIVQAFGVPEPEKICSREWVSMWAASNSFAEDNPIQEEDDLELEGRSSSQRRRLPPTPLRQQNGYQSQVKNRDRSHQLHILMSKGWVEYHEGN